MEAHVDEMIAAGVKTTEGVVEPECEDAKRPVGAMRAGIGQRRAPEIVDKQIGKLRVREKITIR